jgi:hypothetical protein
MTEVNVFPARTIITKEYAISIFSDGTLVVNVGYDGDVEYGPGFTADSAVADWHKKELL